MINIEFSGLRSNSRQFVLCLDLRNNNQARSTDHKEMLGSSEDKSGCG